MTSAHYKTDLTDAQWQLFEPMLPAAKRLGPPRAPLRAAVDGILYLLKDDTPWRLLTRNFPAWQTGSQFFRQ